jgi:hypothetical protein
LFFSVFDLGSACFGRIRENMKANLDTKATLMKIEYSSRLTPISIATFETHDGKIFSFTSPKADSLEVAKIYSIKIAGDKVVEVK